jgi:uncharacterized protein
MRRLNARKTIGAGLTLAGALLLAGLTLPPASAFAQGREDLERYLTAQDLQIVDCQLPPVVRVVGGRPYLAPRKPTRTTGADCRNRGGEFTAYDPANPQTAIDVWRETAEMGDPESQTNVGELYERGTNGQPNYEAAADWYQRAADQGYSRAQFELGSLYERGLGVAQDRLKALNLYRLASGLSADSVIYRSAADAETAELRATLEGQIEGLDRQIELLQRQLGDLQRELDERRGGDDVAGDMNALRALVAQLQSQRSQAQAKLPPAPVEPTRPPRPDTRPVDRRGFGRYYALAIAVQNYETLDDLDSPLKDLERVQSVLHDDYGFEVTALANPSQLDLMRAVNDLNDVLEDDDNLLIYFAGRGNRLPSGQTETGYWLPKNAERPPNDTLWVPNDFITRHLGRFKAKRVLILSDSCYAGLLGDDPGYVMVGDGQYTTDYVKWKKPKRSRLVLASGADNPVLDQAGDGNSVFAHALLQELERNDHVMTAPELFLKLRTRIRTAAGQNASAETPTLKAIKDAGHNMGDFFFVPKS